MLLLRVLGLLAMCCVSVKLHVLECVSMSLILSVFQCVVMLICLLVSVHLCISVCASLALSPIALPLSALIAFRAARSVYRSLCLFASTSPICPILSCGPVRPCLVARLCSGSRSRRAFRVGEVVYMKPGNDAYEDPDASVRRVLCPQRWDIERPLCGSSFRAESTRLRCGLCLLCLLSPFGAARLTSSSQAPVSHAQRHTCFRQWSDRPA